MINENQKSAEDIGKKVIKLANHLIEEQRYKSLVNLIIDYKGNIIYSDDMEEKDKIKYLNDVYKIYKEKYGLKKYQNVWGK